MQGRAQRLPHIANKVSSSALVGLLFRVRVPSFLFVFGVEGAVPPWSVGGSYFWLVASLSAWSVGELWLLARLISLKYQWEGVRGRARRPRPAGI